MDHKCEVMVYIILIDYFLERGKYWISILTQKYLYDMNLHINLHIKIQDDVEKI